MMSNAKLALSAPANWAVAILGPFIALSVYLWLSRWPFRWFTTATDYLALGFAMMIFATAILTIPIPRKIQILILAIVAPPLLLTLVAFCFVFVGFIFDDWL